MNSRRVAFDSSQRITAAARRGTTGPAGMEKGVPLEAVSILSDTLLARTSRRCSSYDAVTHIRYNVSAATFARIASCVKVLLAATVATSKA